MAQFLALFVVLFFSLFPVSCDNDEAPSSDSGGSGDDYDDDNDDDDDNNGTEEAVWSLLSPDGRLEISVEQLNLAGADFPEGKALYYTITRDGEIVLEHSPLGIDTDTQSFVTGMRFAQSSSREVNEEYEMQVGKRSLRKVHGNELTLQFENTAGQLLELVLRAHNDGVAFRYRLPGEGEIEVLGEATGFALPSLSTGFMFPYDILGVVFSGNYERIPRQIAVGDPTSASGWAFPALFEIDGGETWVMLTEADLDENYCGTRLHESPIENVYRIRFPRKGEGNFVGEINPRPKLPLETPWRVAIIGDLATIIESTLVDDLSRASVLLETDWIRPGPVAWSWFSQGTGNAELQREYIQFAAEMGWAHILIDEGWDRWPQVETIMPDLVADADDQGVGVILWYNSGGEHNWSGGTPRDFMLDPDIRRGEMDKLAAWGVAGIKVDFFGSDKQDRIRQYLGILEDAGERGLMVNFHGATIPRGWQRTYPNLMTHEAVQGAEFYKSILPGPTPRIDVLYTFTRNVVGSMDYTPVTFEMALEGVGSTYAHELALSVVFESGWQHFADRADSDPNKGYRAVFDAFPFVGEFFKDIPVTWDDTRLLAGDPRSHVVLARRKGATWFVAGINGLHDEVKIVVPFSFLGPNTYEVRVIRSGASPDEFILETTEMTATDTLEVTMDARDGFVARLSPGKQ